MDEEFRHGQEKLSRTVPEVSRQKPAEMQQSCRNQNMDLFLFVQFAAAAEDRTREVGEGVGEEVGEEEEREEAPDCPRGREGASSGQKGAAAWAAEAEEEEEEEGTTSR